MRSQGENNIPLRKHYFMQTYKEINDGIQSLLETIVEYAIAPFSLINGFPERDIVEMKKVFRDNLHLYITSLKDKSIQYGEIKATKDKILQWE